MKDGHQVGPSVAAPSASRVVDLIYDRKIVNSIKEEAGESGGGWLRLFNILILGMRRPCCSSPSSFTASNGFNVACASFVTI